MYHITALFTAQKYHYKMGNILSTWTSAIRYPISHKVSEILCLDYCATNRTALETLRLT